MNKEKKVDDIAKHICKNYSPYCSMCPDCYAQEEASALYNAGYRKQREGRWKGAGLGDYYCSICCSTYSGGDEYNYCPNCGAKMKEDRYCRYYRSDGMSVT